MVANVVAALGLAAMLVSAPQADGREPKNLPFAQRNGQVEALADVAANTPARLYVHHVDGVIPVMTVPGLANCSPGPATPASRVKFVHLPEADWAEGQHNSEAEDRENASAQRFARDYNRTILSRRRIAVLSACPQARPEKVR